MKNYRSNRIVKTIKQRIAAGDYLLRDFPSERVLADSLSVSHLTARKAVHALVDQGVLVRDERGRAFVNENYAPPMAKVGFISPAYRSVTFAIHLQQVTRYAAELGIIVVPFEYSHWEAPVIADALNTMDGLFICCSTDQIPRDVLSMMRQAKSKLVFIECDMTEHGLVSVLCNHPLRIKELMDFICNQGYSEINLVNCQVHDQEIVRRIHNWEQWKLESAILGELYDMPNESWTDPYPNGYKIFVDIFQRKIKHNSAFVCTTWPAVQGCLRVAYESGLKPGVDFGLGCMSSTEGIQYQCPTVTCLDTPSLKDVVKRSIEWFKQDVNDSWDGELMLYPSSNYLFVGESTQNDN